MRHRPRELRLPDDAVDPPAILPLLDHIRWLAGVAEVRIVRVRDGVTIAIAHDAGHDPARAAPLPASGPCDRRSVFGWASAGVPEATLCLGHGRVAADEVALRVVPLTGQRVLPADVTTAIAALLPLLFAGLTCEARLAAAERRARRAEAALDSSAMGVIVLDHTGAVTFANAAAEALLDRSGGLHRHGSGLRGGTLHDSIALSTALATTSVRGDCAISLHMGGDGSAAPLSVTVLTGADDADGRSCIMWLVDPHVATAPHLRAFAARHALSACEATLVSNIIAGMSVDASAAAAKIRVSTARSHLKSIFVKTGATSQADLLRMVLCTDPRVTNSLVSETV